MDKNCNEKCIKIKIKLTKFDEDSRVEVTSFKKVLARLNQISFGLYKESVPAPLFLLLLIFAISCLYTSQIDLILRRN